MWLIGDVVADVMIAAIMAFLVGYSDTLPMICVITYYSFFKPVTEGSIGLIEWSQGLFK